MNQSASAGDPVGRAVAILAEFLVVERDGQELYRTAVAESSGEVRERLFDFGAEADRRARLLEQALEQLGTPADDAVRTAAHVARLAAVAGRAGDTRHLIEALLLFEIRDELVGETLQALARESSDPRVSEVVGRAALPIESNEAWGAHDTSRHRERIAYLRDLLERRVRADAGLAES